MTTVYVLTRVDTMNPAGTRCYGAFTSRDKAAAAILDWITEEGELIVNYEESYKDFYCEAYITTSGAWVIEPTELDFVM